MSDLTILYLIFSYMFMLGFFAQDIPEDFKDKVITIAILLLAPVSMPFVMGMSSDSD